MMKNYADLFSSEVNKDSELLHKVQIYETQVMLSQLLYTAVHGYKVSKLVLMYLLKISPLTFHRIIKGDVRLSNRKTIETALKLIAVLQLMTEEPQTEKIDSTNLLTEGYKLCETV